jgi:S-adenosylmethionine synthetase
MVNTFGTGKVADQRLSEIVRDTFSLTPAGMIKSLNLRRPVYQQTAAFGHFGRTGDGFTWEAADKAAVLAEAAHLTAAAV